MTTLNEFWPTVPTLTDAQLKQSAVVFPDLTTANYLTQQADIDSTGYIGTTDVRQLSDGRWMMGADVLREFHPETSTATYPPDYAEIITSIGDEVVIEPWEATIAKLQPPSPEEEAVQPWVQPIPGSPDQWFNMGYPFQHQVLHTIDGAEYTMRSLLNFNVWEPSFDARYWEPVPPQAIPWKAGQVWNIGAVVQHYVDDPAFPPPVNNWRSKINANTTEPGHDAGFYRYWEIADDDYDPAAPRPFVSGRAYAIGEQILEGEIVMESTYQSNVWRPADFPPGWKEVEATRARNEKGQFVGDDPSTPDVNEAWE